MTEAKSMTSVLYGKFQAKKPIRPFNTLGEYDEWLQPENMTVYNFFTCLKMMTPLPGLMKVTDR